VFRRKKKREQLRVLDPSNESGAERREASKPPCLAIYLAADGPLSLVEWSDESPGFFVTELTTDNDELVREHFSGAHVYYAGSHTHCSCGFNYGRIPEFERDTDLLARKHHSLAAFSEYLAQEIGRVGEIELFCCRDGEQSAAPEITRALSPSLLLGERFFFYEKELSVVREDAA
jgi:hypothetical protein